MKHFYIFVTLFVVLFSLSENTYCQSYCIPPKYSTGPFTGIINIELGSVSNSSPISDGYADFTSTAQSISLKQGNEETITIDLYYDPSMLDVFQGNVNVRVWIDWNQDYEFDELTETAVSLMENCKSTPNLTQVTAQFTVPIDAKLGTTRMRIYNDMEEFDGHDTPVPCGYLNSTNMMGQHGECEDYAVNILESGTSVGEETDNKGSSLIISPNPATQFTTISYSNTDNSDLRMIITNSLGIEIMRFDENEMKDKNSISFSAEELPLGVYSCTFISKWNKTVKNFIVIR